MTSLNLRILLVSFALIFVPKIATSESLFPLASEASSESEVSDVVVPDLMFSRVTPSEIIKIKWILFQTGDRSGNTGQLTCLNWARSINFSKALDTEGPFHAAVAPRSGYEEGVNTPFWNNSGEAFLVPLASKWDIPIWSRSALDSPKLTMSALYQASKKTKGSATVAIVWDGHFLADFQRSWFDGLIQSKELNGVQGLSWKQRIQNWSTSDSQRIDILEYTVSNGFIKDVGWRSKKINVPNASYGCSGS